MDFFESVSKWPDYVGENWSELLDLSVQHARIVVVAMFFATLIAVGLGVATYHRPAAAKVALTITSTIMTIPSFALFGLLITISSLGLGYRSTVVALVLYALLPILRNTITGLRGVDPAILESALGMGLSRWQRLRRIELPLAWPVILTGIRVATLMTIGIAAIAALVNGPGLGELINEGLKSTTSQRGFDKTFSGTVGVALLALLFDAAFLVIARLTTSKGVR